MFTTKSMMVHTKSLKLESFAKRTLHFSLFPCLEMKSKMTIGTRKLLCGNFFNNDFFDHDNYEFKNYKDLDYDEYQFNNIEYYYYNDYDSHDYYGTSVFERWFISFIGQKQLYDFCTYSSNNASSVTF